MKVRECMTVNVISVRDTTSIEDAARLLARHRISGLPVLDQAGKLVGMVTEYDLIAKEGHKVADIMTRGLISITPDTDIEEVSHLLAHKRIRRVAVVEGDQLVGIVSRSDLVRQIAMRWVCPTCGEVVRDTTAPLNCPRCHAPRSVFTHEIEPPGM